MAIYFDDIQSDVASIFLSYFQRAPEFEAMQHYVGVLQALQANPDTAGNAFNLLAAHIYADGVASQEVPAGPTVTDSWYVSYLYSNVLGRAPDAEGLAYWVAELQAGNIARAELVGTFVAAALASEGRDAAYLNNRTQVAVEFAQWENSNPQVLPTLKYNAAEVLQGVNEDPATVAIAESRLETTTGVVGVTENLTKGIDNLEGTTGNDTFNAVFTDASTFTAFDTIDGDLGTDTFNIYVGNVGTVVAPEYVNDAFPDNAIVRNVEVVNIYGGANAAGSLTNAANYQGVQQLWQIDSASAVTGLGADTAAGFRNIKDLAASVTATNSAASVTVALENVGQANDYEALSVGGESVATVNVVGALNAASQGLLLMVQAGDGVESVAVNTAVDTMLFLWAGEDDAGDVVKSIKNIDMSGSTGDILLTLEGDKDENIVATGLTATFGSGDDMVFFADDRTLSLRDVIDGGEGNNTLALEVSGVVQTQTYDAIARVSNFQNVAFLTDTTATIDAAQLEGFDSIWVGDDGSFVVKNLSSDVELVIASDDLFGIEEPESVTLLDAAADISISVDGDLLAYVVVGTADAKQVGATGGELTLSGEGGVLFSNAITGGAAPVGKFSVIDATELEGVTATEAEIAAELPGVVLPAGDYNVGLLLAQVDAEGEIIGSGLSSAVAETIKLNLDTIDAIMLESDVSTYGRMDTIEGFNSDAKAGVVDYLVAYASLEKLTLTAEATTLQLAFAEAAAKSTDDDVADVLFFVFDGDTYLFSDTEGGETGKYDNADFALKVVGSHDLANSWVNLTPPPDVE